MSLLFVDSEYGIDAYFPRTGFSENNRIEAGKTYLSPRAEATPANGAEHMIVIAVRAEPFSDRTTRSLPSGSMSRLPSGCPAT